MKTLEDRKFNLHHGKAGAAIAVRVTPRMSKNEIYEILDNGTIKIRLTAPPVDGKANAALAEFLAKILNVPVGNIEIVAGITGRDKLITILNMTSDQVQQKILENLK